MLNSDEINACLPFLLRISRWPPSFWGILYILPKIAVNQFCFSINECYCQAKIFSILQDNKLMDLTTKVAHRPFQYGRQCICYALQMTKTLLVDHIETRSWGPFPCFQLLSVNWWWKYIPIFLLYWEFQDGHHKFEAFYQIFHQEYLTIYLYYVYA